MRDARRIAVTTVIATVIVDGDVLPSILTTDHGEDNGEQPSPRCASLAKVQTRTIELILNRSKYLALKFAKRDQFLA
jgi:hypothetical protein